MNTDGCHIKHRTTPVYTTLDSVDTECSWGSVNLNTKICTPQMYTGIHLAGGSSLISIESTIIAMLVYLLPLISIVSATAVSGDSSLCEGPVWFNKE